MAERYPREKAYWSMFYLSSAFAVNHLATRYPEKWKAFWDYAGMLVNRRDFPPQLQIEFSGLFNYAFGFSLRSFSGEYDKVLTRYGWQFPLIGINLILLAALPFILIAAFRRSRRKLKAMEEASDDTEESSENTPLNPS